MKSVLAGRLTPVWVVLSAVTVVSWLLGRTAHDSRHVTSSTAITIGVLAIAFVKTRLVIQEFMEVRTAPRLLQRFTDVWLVVFWGAVLGIYLY